MVHVLRQRHEGVFLVDAAATPGLGLGFKGADHQLACVFLVIGAFIRHADDRHVARKLCNRLRHNVEMFAGMERDVDANGTAQLARPHSGSDHHLVR